MQNDANKQQIQHLFGRAAADYAVSGVHAQGYSLDRLLEPGGWLGVMTCFRQPGRDFASWHYRRDPTHVVFYREATFRRLADRLGWNCEFPSRDVFLAKKR